MKVKDILDEFHRHPITIKGEQTIDDAMTILDINKIGALIVVNESDEPIGILTERDILRMMYKHRQNIRDKVVKDSMSTNLVIGVPDDDLDYIAHMITQNKIRHIPIIDGSNHLCGIVSIGDIVKAKMDSAEVQARYLQEYITGRQHTANE